jgi:hypothetical protein
LHTDLDIGALIVGNARVGRACMFMLAKCRNRGQRECVPRSMPMAPS